jgi:TPP-dependent pyruvate/acetoin dehydrogenase alpha subunit
MNPKEGLHDVLATGYFNKDEVKRHAYVELMTLKTILITKGLFTEEEFDALRAKVNQEITKEVGDKIDEMLKNNSKEAAVMNVLSGLFKSNKEEI